MDVRCDYCGKEYKKVWNHYIRENRRSEIHTDCCNDCKKYKIVETSKSKYGVPFYVCTQNKKGDKNPRWKGGVAYHRQERATFEYIDWRKAVFIRNDYTCQCCGAKNGNGHTVELNAHHVRNWKDNPSVRYDVDNGITLCSPCHL